VAYCQVSARIVSVPAQNNQLAIPDRDTVKTQPRDMGHDETWKLETEPREDIQVSRDSAKAET